MRRTQVSYKPEVDNLDKMTSQSIVRKAFSSNINKRHKKKAEDDFVRASEILTSQDKKRLHLNVKVSRVLV